GDYKLADIQGYIKGFVVAFIENDTFFQEDFTVIDNILMAKIPGPCQNKFISTPLRELLENCESEDLINIPEKVILKGDTLFNEIMVDSNTQQVDPNLISDPIGDLSEVEEITDDEALEGDDTSQLDKFGIAVQPEPEPEPEPKEPLRVHLGENAFTHEKLYWEPTNTAKFMNTNTGIIGTMGTGKTQFTKSLIAQLMQNQTNNVNSAPIGMLIFDYKSDYVDDEFIKVTNAQKYKLFKLPYNPLSLFGDSPMLPIHTATGFAETMRKAFNLGIKQQLKLENLILACYEDVGINSEDPSTWSIPAPTIDD